MYCLPPLGISVATFAFPYFFSHHHKRRLNAICCKKKQTPNGGSWKIRKRNLRMAPPTRYNAEFIFLYKFLNNWSGVGLLRPKSAALYYAINIQFCWQHCYRLLTVYSVYWFTYFLARNFHRRDDGWRITGRWRRRMTVFWFFVYVSSG